MGDFELEDIEDMIKKFMENFDFQDKLSGSKGPVVWGFSMTVGPDKKPIFRQFGDMHPKVKEKALKQLPYDPLTDVIEEPDTITVIAEIPGVRNTDINLNATERKLTIIVDTAELKFFKEVHLPCEVKSQTAKARYKNDILEIKMKKQNLASKGTPIKVD
ncbi:MAG: Hsp20/alpha crystallin family protein [Promethearchaeota archaeon]|nr:MAG: Hsp20/alpha crystallin family protein [Candidatus Lokiarchaeota archaeon]